jgi:hypothetical protein
MLTCGQGDFRLGLTAAKMNVVEIARDRLIERRQSGIDEKVMMTGIWLRGAGRSDLHVLDPETDLDLGGDRRAVLEIDKEYPGIRSRRLPRRSRLLRANLDTRIQSYCGKNNQADAEKNSNHKQLPCHANMSLQGEQVAVADRRSEVAKLLRDEAHALLQMACCNKPCCNKPCCEKRCCEKRWRTDRSRLARRRCSLKTGLISDRLPALCP